MLVHKYSLNRSWQRTSLLSTERAVAMTIADGANSIEEIAGKDATLTMAQIHSGITGLYSRGLLVIRNDDEMPGTEARTAGRDDVVQVSEKLSLKILRYFDISKIATTFRIAEFERKVSKSHVRNIADAILRDDLYDNTITVMMPEHMGDAYEVIDGQNRLAALAYLFKRKLLYRFTLVLRILASKDARKAYRMINSGRPLTSADIMKSMDDGTVLFFNAFRDYCAHYKSTHKVPYSMLAYAYYYSTKTDRFILHRKAILENIGSMPSAHADAVTVFFEIVFSLTAWDAGSHVFKIPVFWNLLKLYFVKYRVHGAAIVKSRFPRLVTAMIEDERIKQLSVLGKNKESIAEVYSTFEAMWESAKSR